MKIPLTHAAYLRSLYAERDRRQQKMIMAGRVLIVSTAILAALVAIAYLSH